MLTILIPKNEKIMNFLKIEDLVAKRYFYTTLDYKETTEVTKYCTSDKFWICSRSYKLMPSKDNYFLKQTEYHGLSIENKKIKFWKEENVWQNCNIRDALIEHFNLNWYSKKLDFIVDKILLKKILTKKVTNNEQILKYYIKKNKFDCSVNLLKEYIKYDTSSSINSHLKNMFCCTNQDEFLKLSIDKKLSDIPHIFDMFKQSYILGKKINLKWSLKRMEIEHSKMTEQLMAIAENFVEDEIIDINLKQEIPERFEILNSKKRVFKEGFTMKHCIYTNYWSAIKEKSYIAFHDKKLNVTIGCRVKNDILIHDQINGKYNNFIHTAKEYNEICQLLKLHNYSGEGIYQTQNSFRGDLLF